MLGENPSNAALRVAVERAQDRHGHFLSVYSNISRQKGVEFLPLISDVSTSPKLLPDGHKAVFYHDTHGSPLRKEHSGVRNGVAANQPSLLL